jgi:AbrB family looped-hinge helix DNA binding protein
LKLVCYVDYSNGPRRGSVILEPQEYDRMYKVGTKGQVVIDKRLRDRLGIGPGWIVLQRLVDDHIEFRFLPPKPRDSLYGILAPYTNVSISPEEWHEAKEKALADAFAEESGTSYDAR